MGALRKAGKTTWAYLEGAESPSYQSASQCDKVMLASWRADIPAPAMSVTFFKDALDLLGVQFDVVRCGDFKGAVEPYVLSQMSGHLRAHYLAMVERMNASIVDRIARGRRIPAVRVRELQAAHLHRARGARGGSRRLARAVGRRRGRVEARHRRPGSELRAGLRGQEGAQDGQPADAADPAPQSQGGER